jgi:glycosyltransferase involved in cell wall biosynthesis
MTEVLFVSKPVVPPWNDSSKNLVRDIAGNLRRCSAVVMGREGQESPVQGARAEGVYGPRTPSSFSPSLRANVAVLRHLLWRSNADIWHFFFAPNLKSSAAARFATSTRRVPSVHTVCSMPREGASLKRLVFADATVTLSRFAYDRFSSAGVHETALRLIPPSVPPLAEPSASDRLTLRRKHQLPAGASLWVYPGDLEQGGGAEITLRALASSSQPDALLLMACRSKTRGAATERARLAERAKRWGVERRVRWIGETRDILEFLALGDFVVLPNQTPFAKMDYPLVVLEAMCLARPVVVGAGTPAAELAEAGGAMAVETEADAVAELIDRLHANTEATQALGRRARALALGRFSPRAGAAAYERLYEEIHA